MEDLPPRFTYQQARSTGLTRHAIHRLHETGTFVRIAHGIYRQRQAPLADEDLTTLAVRAPRATLCLVSALAHHDLTDIIPAEHDVALPRGTWHPQVQTQIRWHDFARPTFDLGRGTLDLDGTTRIGIYDPARSIVDAIRLSDQVGSDVAYEALRRWLRAGGAPAALLTTARAFPRTLPTIRRALEVLQ